MDEYTFKRLFLNRTIIIIIVLVAILGAISVNLFSLQITNHSYYRTLAEGNRFKLTPKQPPRGLIYDRNGNLLATNKTVYNLEMPASMAPELPQTLERIAKIISITPQNVQRLARTSKYTTDYHNIILRSHLSEPEVAKIAINLHQLDGVEINGAVVRHYPYKELFSHLIGYVGLLSEKDIKHIDQRNYRGQRYIGKTGVERFYEKMLHGRIGFNKIEVNAKGRLIRTVENYKPHPGSDLMLTVDKDMQQAAYDALDKHSGAAIVLDVRNGDILAAVSRPSFDANLFVYPFSKANYLKLQSDTLKPFFNRAISGQYPPGSTIKPIIALTALEQQIVEPDYYIDAGPFWQLPGHPRRYRDWRKEGHGLVNLSDSIVQSCDVFFYELAYNIGIERMASSFKQFGLGEKTGIDTTSEATGLVPTPQWKRNVLHQVWLPAETIIAGIGQGYMLATPLQMAVAVSIIANRGQRITPRIVKAIRNNEKWNSQMVRWKPKVRASKKSWDYVIDAMESVVHKPNGTAYRMSHDMIYSVAGKTGTVQLVSLDEFDHENDTKTQEKHLIDHGMFIAFAPIDKPEIAIAVLLEHSGSGSIAAVASRQILDAYFKKTTRRVALNQPSQ